MARTLRGFSPWRHAALLCAALALAACGVTPEPGVGGLDARPFPDVSTVDPGKADVPPPQDLAPDAEGNDPGPGELPPGDDGPDAPGTPRIAAEPAALDLGFCSQGVPARRTLAIRNDGTAPLRVTSVQLVQDSGGEITVDASAVLAGPVTAGASAVMTVQALNAGADTGTLTGLLRIASNDPGHATLDVPVSGQRAGAPVCRFAVVPSGPLALGAVPAGSAKDVLVNVMNTGTGTFEIRRLDLHACTTQEDSVVCGPSLGEAAWADATVPSGIPSQVAPGASAQIRLRVSLPATTAAKGLAARLVVTWACLSAEPPAVSTWPEDCEPDALCPPNVTASVAPAVLKAEPSPVTFPDTPPGCDSRASVALKNPGSGAASVTAVAVDPECPDAAAFRLANQPGLPANISAGGSLSFPLVFEPVAPGTVGCDLVFQAEAPGPVTIRVPLAGPGLTSDQTTDRFLADTGDADVLLVMDSSGSMGEALERTKSGLDGIMEAYDDRGVSPRLGVIGLSVDPGCPRAGWLRGSPRVMDETTWTAFPDTVDQMVADLDCDPSMAETGLEAARTALSSPLVDDQATACAGDGACSPPYGCVDGFCGGPNRGFLRPQAALEVIVISDEDDQSPGKATDYALFLLGAKGPGGEGRARLHVVGGERGNGCQNGFDIASASDRYLQVMDATGGFFATMCQESLDDALAQVALSPAPLRARFPLSGKPRQDTLEVKVAGTVCEDGWSVKGSPSFVEFARGGDCFPAPGAEILVRYSPACP